MWFLALTVLAAETPDEEALRALLSSSMGKDVPAKYLCVEKPVLPAPFSGEEPVVVAGVKLKGRGCVRKIIVHKGRVVAERDALPAVLPQWGALDAVDKDDAVRAWTANVLHAFEQIQAGPEVRRQSSTREVDVTALRRSPVKLVAEEVRTTWTFDADGNVKASHDDPVLWKSALVLKVNSAKGIDAAQVTHTLESVGKILEKCFWAAWQHDLAIHERTRITWTVEDTRATRLAARQQTSGRLTQCYANVIGRAEFPADGTVDVDFGVTRVPIDALPVE